MSSIESLPVRKAVSRPHLVALAAAAALVCTILPRSAFAQRDLRSRPGDRGYLVFDQLSGFRANLTGGLSYDGPIGLAIQKYKQDNLDNDIDPKIGQSTTSTTTFFLSPSADYFVIDHLSVGGHLEVSTVSGSVEVQETATRTQRFDLPTRTNIVLLPRVGWMFALSDRWGIWPRGGLGYVSQQEVVGDPNNATTIRTSAALLQIDVGFLYKFTDNLFLRLAPETSFTLGGARSRSFGNTTRSVDASLFQFSLTGGFGGMLDLL